MALLIKKLERIFINVVNDVGVHINRCAQYPHAAGVLQFVAGLGPKKAAQLLLDIQIGVDNVGDVHNNDIEVDIAKHNLLSREHLLDRELVGSRVF
jgi:transcriptional accessory protein Tex/SPT6